MRRLERIAAAVVLILAPVSHAQVRPLVDEVIVEAGVPTAIPIEIGPATRPQDIVHVGIDGRLVLSSEVHRIVVEPRLGELDATLRWLGIEDRWRALHNEETPRDPGLGFWIVMVQPPAAPGGTIRVAGQAVRTRWVSAGEFGVPGPGVEAAETAADLQPVLNDPRLAWRARLASGSLADSGSTPRDFSDPVATLLLDRERRLALALTLLAEADESLAQRVVFQLVRALRFDGGVRAPAWAPDDRELSSLVDLLLAADATPRSRSIAAELWLERRPAVVARLIDHAGTTDESGEPAGMVALANLDRVPLVCAVQRQGAAAVPLVVEAGSTARATIRMPERGTAAIALVRGDQAQPLGLIVGPAPVVPPGATLGPARADLTLATWRTGSERTGATAVLIDPMPRGLSRVRTWRAIIECAGPSGPDDRVDLWLGPPERSTLVRVFADGRAVDARGGALRGITVVRERDRWVASVPIPPQAIEPGRGLRVGYLRDRGSAGGREAWPVALMPWDEQPGRALIDLSAWDLPISGPPRR